MTQTFKSDIAINGAITFKPTAQNLKEYPYLEDKLYTGEAISIRYTKAKVFYAIEIPKSQIPEGKDEPVLWKVPSENVEPSQGFEVEHISPYKLGQTVMFKPTAWEAEDKSVEPSEGFGDIVSIRFTGEAIIYDIVDDYWGELWKDVPEDLIVGKSTKPTAWTEGQKALISNIKSNVAKMEAESANNDEEKNPNLMFDVISVLKGIEVVPESEKTV